MFPSWWSSFHVSIDVSELRVIIQSWKWCFLIDSCLQVNNRVSKLIVFPSYVSYLHIFQGWIKNSRTSNNVFFCVNQNLGSARVRLTVVNQNEPWLHKQKRGLTNQSIRWVLESVPYQTLLPLFINRNHLKLII